MIDRPRRGSSGFSPAGIAMRGRFFFPARGGRQAAVLYPHCRPVELGYMEPADKKRMALRILGAYEKECFAMLDFVDKFPDLEETPAQFQERRAQVALKCFWREKHADVLIHSADETNRDRLGTGVGMQD